MSFDVVVKGFHRIWEERCPSCHLLNALVVLPEPNNAPTALADVNAPAISHVLFPLSVIHVTVSIGVDSLALLAAISPVAFIHIGVLELQPTLKSS